MNGSQMRDRALRTATVALAATVLVSAVRAAHRRRRAWIGAGRYEQRALTETFDLPSGREPLYWLLREPTGMASLLDPDAKVVVLDEARSRWTLAGPRGEPVTCSVHLVGDVPEMMVSWSVPDGPLPHHGRVELQPAPTGTRVRAQVRYLWSRRFEAESGIDPEAPARVLRRVRDQLRALASAHAYR